jgi:succinyl-CoA synthetase beta subunit
MLAGFVKSSSLFTRVARSYNLHEYQSLKYLSSFNLPVPRGDVAENAAAAASIVQSMGVDEIVIKA